MLNPLHCPCCLHHSPRVMTLETHHLLPLSWGGKDAALNKVRICPSAHYGIHGLLNEYVRAKGTPTRAVLDRYPHFVQEAAAGAWRDRPDGHPTPYWLPVSAPIHAEEPEGMGRVRELMGWADRRSGRTVRMSGQSEQPTDDQRDEAAIQQPNPETGQLEVPPGSADKELEVTDEPAQHEVKSATDKPVSGVGGT